MHSTRKGIYNARSMSSKTSDVCELDCEQVGDTMIEMTVRIRPPF